MFTVLGATGFIGGKLVAALRRQGHDVYAPARDDTEVLKRDLGDVIYAIGLTADFRTRPLETVEAHVCVLHEFLRAATFRSFLYLSSTRVYAGSPTAQEEQRLTVDPVDPDQLYNLSKLMGESLCLASGRDTVRVARLSNVYGGAFGSENFLSQLLRQAIRERKVALRTSRESAKDYVSVDDVVELLPRIAVAGTARMYNVACGRNVSNGELIDGLSRLERFAVADESDAPTVTFPQISIQRARSEFGFSPRGIIADLPALVAQFKGAGLTT